MENQQLHPDYPFKTGDKVIVTDKEGKKEFAQVAYFPELASFLLIYFQDKTFTMPVPDQEKGAKNAFIFEVGFKSLELLK